MAEQTTASQQAAAPMSAHSGESFIKRELEGASFLTLEHVAHMALAVIVPSLLAAGLAMAIGMWTGSRGSLVSSIDVTGSLGGFMNALMGIGIAAALLVLVPLLVVFDKRTRAEWLKRPGYTGRLAYKAPVYTALGVLAVTDVVLFISMLTTVISSLALIGVANAGIGGMYLDQFLPAIIALVIFGAATVYVCKLVKGRDFGKMFSLANAVFGLALFVALLITSIVVLHSSSNIQPASSNSSDLFKSLNNLNDGNSSGNGGSDSFQNLFGQ
jgi:hypothetical protein